MTKEMCQPDFFLRDHSGIKGVTKDRCNPPFSRQKGRGLRLKKKTLKTEVFLRAFGLQCPKIAQTSRLRTVSTASVFGVKKCI
jgi:hypothetical protein